MKRRTSIAGSALAVLIMLTVLYFYGGDLRNVEISRRALLPGVIASLTIYTAVVCIGAVAWRLLLKAFGVNLEPWTAERQLLVSQIGKYFPGNVAQYIGRAAMAMKAGIPATIIALAIMTETVGIFIGASLSVGISVAADPGVVGEVSRLLPNATRYMWLIMAAFSILLLIAVGSLSYKVRNSCTFLLKARWTIILLVIMLYTSALLLLGCSLHLIVTSVGITVVPLSLSIAIFSAAWLVGLSTPGAPGGLGLRESVITIGLAPFTGGATALSIALLHRGVSVLGDIFSFAIGMGLPKPSPCEEKI